MVGSKVGSKVVLWVDWKDDCLVVLRVQLMVVLWVGQMAATKAEK